MFFSIQQPTSDNITFQKRPSKRDALPVEAASDEGGTSGT